MVIALNIVDLYNMPYLVFVTIAVGCMAILALRMKISDTLYHNNIQKRCSVYRTDIYSRSSRRGAVGSFSAKAIKRYLLFAIMNRGLFRAFLTLTTKTALSSKQFKIALNEFMKKLVQYNIAALWVVELQERGAMHVHMLLTQNLDYRVVNKLWNGCQYRFSQENIEQTCSNISNFHDKHIFYLAKYLTSQQKNQNGFNGRRWGYSVKNMWQLPLNRVKEVKNLPIRNEVFMYEMIKNEAKHELTDLFMSETYDLIMFSDMKYCFSLLERFNFSDVEVRNA